MGKNKIYFLIINHVSSDVIWFDFEMKKQQDNSWGPYMLEQQYNFNMTLHWEQN